MLDLPVTLNWMEADLMILGWLNQIEVLFIRLYQLPLLP